MSYRQVTERERYFLTLLLSEGKSKTDIAKIMGRSRSTIQREINRNSDSRGHYKPLIAHRLAKCRRRDSRQVTYFTEEQWALVWGKIRQQWAPEQISGRLAENGELEMHFATIYRHLRFRKRHGGTMHRHLRQSNKKRRKGYGHADSRGVLRGKTYISERPEAANQRSEYGHYEVDLVRGFQGWGHVLTMADRMTRYTQVVKLKNKSADEVARKLIPLVKKLKIKTLTADNGCEFHGYKSVETATGVRYFFANPHCSWERGTIENMNGLIRQYLPKKEVLTHVTQRYCRFIERRLNQRPRKMFNFKTPEEYYHEVA